MTDSGVFCPNCGKPAPNAGDRQAPPGAGAERRRADALCDACYLERFDLVDAPDRLEIRVCSRCGAVHRGNRWVDVGARDYTDIAIETVQGSLGVHVDADEVTWTVDPEQAGPNTIRVHARFTGVVRETPVEEAVTVPVKIARGTCTRCGRIAGDYYAGVVQVRARGREPTSTETDRATEIAADVVADMEATGDRNAFVTDVSDVDGGLDIKVSTTRIGEKVSRKLVEEFGGRYDSSETLVTEDEDGNPVYRVTYAVRLPRFTPGDVIDPADGNGPVLVRSVSGNLKGRRLSTGDPFEAGMDLEARKLASVDDAAETTLVSVEDDHAVQVLDPETYRSTTIPRPADLDPSVDTVTVVKTRAGLHVLPDA